MKTFVNMNDVIKTDIRMTSTENLWEHRIKYLLKKQIKILVTNEYNHSVVLNVSKSKPLFLFENHVFYQQGDKYYGIKKSKLKGMLQKC